MQKAAGTDARPAAVGGRGDVRVIELTSTQTTIARRMVESATTVPVFTVSVDIDMSLVAELRGAATSDKRSATSETHVHFTTHSQFAAPFV